MASGSAASREEVLAVGGFVGSEDGSGVRSAEEFRGFQRWISNDTSSSSSAAQKRLRSDSEPARTSIVDCSSVELYDACGGRRNAADSWDSSTEASGSDAFSGRSNSGSGFSQESQERHTRKSQMSYSAQKDSQESRSIIQEVKYRSGSQSTKSIRQSRRRDRLYSKRQKNYDIITACLQAVSQKRRVDTRSKFTIEPSSGNNGFQQWYDASKAVARLPTGIPKEWRKKVWLTLADQYLHSISIDWEKTLRFAFNERSNPDDDSLGIQIVKDSHRTGCSSYCGQEGEQDRVVSKRVSSAYARWNKAVGYCQGFNVSAASISEVTEGNESDASKVMIYSIDKVLPDSYFANNSRALSVDMAVFRDSSRVKSPRSSQHSHHSQKAANREAGGSYEPPLTNVFTMQWFLTMFATCSPAPTVLKIWDSVFFEGSEVSFRVASVIWERSGERIEDCQTADEFYSIMGVSTQEMSEQNLVHPAESMQEVYSMAVFPFPQSAELREKYTYNITPFPTAAKSSASSGPGGWDSEEDGDVDDEDSVVTALGCSGPSGGSLAPESQRYQKHLKEQRAEQGSIAESSPGAVGGGRGRAEHQAAINSMMMERMSTDISASRKQYARIKRRQQQQAAQLCIRTDRCPATRVSASQLNPSSAVINHLSSGRKPRAASRTGRPVCAAPPGSPSRRRCGSSLSSGTSSPGSSRGSPWRARVQQHRRNVARARVQLGFGGSEEREEEEEEEEEESVPETEGGGSGWKERPSDVEEVKVEEVQVQSDSSDSQNDPEPEPEVEESKAAALPPPSSSSDGHQEEEELPAQSSSPIDAAPPPSSSSPPDLPPPPSSSSSPPDLPPPSSSSPPDLPPPSSSSPPDLPPPPSSSSPPDLPPSSSSSPPDLPPPSSPDLPPPPSSSSSARRQNVFSPFPLIKPPRKSAAARNSGLYGPTSRTPTLHFPQSSRGSNRSGGAGTAAAQR